MTRWATFDCYGTLIDWNGGIGRELERLFGAEQVARLLHAYHEIEPEVQREQPDRAYRDVLAVTLARLAEREGLPLERLVEALMGGAARSWVLENRAKNVIEDSYPLGFKVALHLKDLRIALDEAARNGLELAVSRVVADEEQRLVEAGFADEDVSNVARVAKGELDARVP